MPYSLKVNLKTNLQGKRTIELRPTFNESNIESRASPSNEYDSRNSIFNATQLRQSHYNSDQTHDNFQLKPSKMEVELHEKKLENQ